MKKNYNKDWFFFRKESSIMQKFHEEWCCASTAQPGFWCDWQCRRKHKQEIDGHKLCKQHYKIYKIIFEK